MSVYLPAIMSFGMVGSGIRKKREEEQKRKQLLKLKESIDYTKAEIDSAMQNFNNVKEERLVDFYIYKIQAEQSRYDQLILEYREKCEMIMGD